MENGTTDVIGVPTLALLPPKNFKFKVADEIHKLVVPSKGKYIDIDPEFFSDDDGDFVIHEKGVFNISVITKVLFAARKYPLLEDNQLFCPINFKMLNGEVEIYGQVVTMAGFTE